MVQIRKKTTVAIIMILAMAISLLFQDASNRTVEIK
jgi:hypothetical protein